MEILGWMLVISFAIAMISALLFDVFYSDNVKIILGIVLILSMITIFISVGGLLIKNREQTQINFQNKIEKKIYITEISVIKSISEDKLGTVNHEYIIDNTTSKVKDLSKLSVGQVVCVSYIKKDSKYYLINLKPEDAQGKIIIDLGKEEK